MRKKLRCLLDHDDVIKSFPVWDLIETTPRLCVKQSLLLLVKHSLVSYLLVTLCVLEVDDLSRDRNSLEPQQKLNLRVEYVHRTPKFKIVATPLHDLNNDTFA